MTAREDPLKLQVFFSYSKDFFWSGFIRWWTVSDISHAGFIADFAGGTERYAFVVGAEAGGVEFIPLHVFQQRGNIIRHLYEPKFDLRPAFHQMWKIYGGAEYDYGAGGTLGIQGRLPGIWSRWGKGIRDALVDEKEVMCTELVIRTLHWAHTVTARDADPETTNARLLHEAVQRNPMEFAPVPIAMLT
jgi:hypothetical protein